MSRLVLILALLFSVQSVVLAEERRLSITPQTDYFGGDYDVLRDVELDICKQRCLAEKRCKAFTYQESAQWCFLKENVGERRPITGATAGLIETGNPIVPVDEELVAKRGSLVSFLPKRVRERARRLRLAYPVAKENSKFSESSIETLLEISTKSLSTVRGKSALYEALRRDIGNSVLWKQLTLTELANKPKDYKSRRKSNQLERQAAVNMVLLANDDVTRADAFRLLASVYEKQEGWKIAIRALREAQKIETSEEAGKKLEALLGKYGFRITTNKIDADTARPRACLIFSDLLGSAVTTDGRAGDFVRVEGGSDLPVTASGNQICVDGIVHGGRYRIVARSGISSEDGETLRRDISTDVYVRDRRPSVHFASNAYVLPAGGDVTIPRYHDQH